MLMALVYSTFSLAEQIQSGEVANGTNGVTVTGDVTQIEILDVVSEITASSTNWLFIGVFVAIWIVSNFSHGAIKNIAGKGYSRNKIFLTKCVSSIVTAVVMNIIIFAVMVIMGAISFGTDGINAEFYKDLFSYTGVQLMLTVAFTNVIVMVSEIVRNAAAGISISMAIVMFSESISGVMDLLLKKVGIDFRVSKYWLSNLVAECPMGAIEVDFVKRTIFVTVLWSLVAITIGIFHFKRTDIK